MIKFRINSSAVRPTASDPGAELRPSPAVAVGKEAPWVRTLQEWMVKITYEATRTEMLVGLGLGATFFQVGRTLGLRALLAGGIRGPAALALGRAAGLATEATGFIAASRGTALAMGQPVEHDWTNLGREWLSMAFFLGVMRSTHWGVRQAYGPTWAPKTAWQSFHHSLAQQGASYAAVVGTAAAEWKWGWRHYQDTKQLLGNSLALMGSFQMAGALAHHGIGHRLAPIEKSLEAKAGRLEQRTSGGNGLGFFGARLALEGVGEDPTAIDSMGRVFIHGDDSGGGGKDNAGIWNWESLTGRIRDSSHVIPVVGPGEIKRHITAPDFIKKLVEKDFFFEISGTANPNQFLEKLLQEINDRTQNGKAEDGKKPIPAGRRIHIRLDPEVTSTPNEMIEIVLDRNGFTATPLRTPPPPLPAPALKTDEEPLESTSGGPRLGIRTSRASAELSLLNIGEAEAPIPAVILLEFSRKVRTDPMTLQQDLEQHDRLIQLGSSIGFKMEIALQVLNSLPHLEKIIEGRKVTFSWPRQEKPQIAVKQGDQFQDSTQGDSRPPSTPRHPLPAASVSNEDKGPLSDGGETSSTLWEASYIPPFFENPQHLSALFRQTAQAKFPGTPKLILERKTASMDSLREATDDKILGLDDGTSWEILVPKNPKTDRVFSVEIKNREVLWKPGALGSWERAERQVHFSNRIIANPAEIFQHLEAMSRSSATLPPIVRFKHRGILTYNYVVDLAPFIEHILDLYPVKSDHLEMVNEAGKEILKFSQKGNRWKYKVGMTSPPPG